MNGFSLCIDTETFVIRSLLYPAIKPGAFVFPDSELVIQFEWGKTYFVKRPVKMMVDSPPPSPLYKCYVLISFDFYLGPFRFSSYFEKGKTVLNTYTTHRVNTFQKIFLPSAPRNNKFLSNL